MAASRNLYLTFGLMAKSNELLKLGT